MPVAVSRWVVGLTVALIAGVAIGPAAAQTARATVRGQVVVADGAAVPDVLVTMKVVDGAVITTATTDAAGRFVIHDVAPGQYVFTVAAGGLVAGNLADVRFAARADITLQLQAPAFDGGDYVVTGELDLDRARWDASGDVLRAQPARLQSRALTGALAAAPGWAEEDNGLLHVRGVDDGVLYVEDGVPVYDRLDVAFGVPPSLAGLGSLTVITGHTPPQFGLKSGAVVQLFTPPAPTRWSGSVQAGLGSTSTNSGSASAGGPTSGGLDVFTAVAAERSDRFLDPVHPDSYHDAGGVAGGSIRGRVGIGGDGQLVGRAQGGRSRFEVPNGVVGNDAGQDQRQRVSQQALALSAQRLLGMNWWVDGAAYGRRLNAALTPSSRDTPLTAASHRRHDRAGLLASISTNPGAHHLVAGGEASRVTLREDFQFAVTDPDTTALSRSALGFTPSHPFAFAGHAARSQWSLFAQDRLWNGPWMLDAGVRYDHTDLLVAASQWSPRIAVTYDMWRIGTVRASYNRFFQPPQAEHLLLASSEAARVLSPFVDDGEGGGAAIAPERQTAWEVGFQHWRSAHLRLDIAAWHRAVRNYADPNVFFGTTIVFPNSVARGTARGLDVRLTLPAEKGFTASASYTLSRVEQAGPINGGLFLEDDIDEIGSGARFTPDHDQRHAASATASWVQPVGVWSASAQARVASGTPLDVGDLDVLELADLATRPGADLIDLDRGRVKPRLVVDLTASRRVRHTSWGALTVSASVLNFFDRRYAFNFGNPFSGTHFGAPRQFRLDATVNFD